MISCSKTSYTVEPIAYRLATFAFIQVALTAVLVIIISETAGTVSTSLDLSEGRQFI